MNRKQLYKIYDKYCYNKNAGMFEQWEETLNKLDDETIKNVFINYGDKISDLSALRCYIIETLPEKEGLKFMGYENIEELKAEIQAKTF